MRLATPPPCPRAIQNGGQEEEGGTKTTTVGTGTGTGTVVPARKPLRLVTKGAVGESHGIWARLVLAVVAMARLVLTDDRCGQAGEEEEGRLVT
jgi:hypothetical protein